MTLPSARQASLPTDEVLTLSAAVARATAGVDSLQPDVWGLVQQLGKELWQRIGGGADDTAGVELIQDEGHLGVEICLVADDRRKVADTVRDVQQRVIENVRTELGVNLDVVSVNVVRITVH